MTTSSPSVGTELAWGLTLGLLGIGLTGALWYLFPLWDILEMFFVVVIIPLMLLVAFGLISSGGWQMIRAAVAVNRSALVERLEAYQKATQAKTEAQTTPAAVVQPTNLSTPDPGVCGE